MPFDPLDAYEAGTESKVTFSPEKREKLDQLLDSLGPLFNENPNAVAGALQFAVGEDGTVAE